jgi:hypothetical protein
MFENSSISFPSFSFLFYPRPEWAGSKRKLTASLAVVKLVFQNSPQELQQQKRRALSSYENPIHRFAPVFMTRAAGDAYRQLVKRAVDDFGQSCLEDLARS